MIDHKLDLITLEHVAVINTDENLVWDEVFRVAVQQGVIHFEEYCDSSYASYINSYW